MSFRISGIAPKTFSTLAGLSDAELAKHRAVRVTVQGPGYPERIEMRDAQPGEVLLLVNYEHQPADTPYKASHAVYVREGATDGYSAVDALPDVMKKRLLSLRAFGADHMLVEADVVEGTRAIPVIEQMFSKERVAYIQAHYAKPGCFAAQISRVE
jgi:Protein of unknown function (DUF1203)